MTDAPLPNVQATQETEDTHVILTALINPEGQQQSSSVSSGFVSNMLNPRPDTGIDSIFTLNTEATSLIDVPVTTIAEPPLVSATTLPPPPTPLITHMQQTPVPTPTTVPSTSLQDLPNFGSLFGFDHRLKTLETDFSKFKQMNQFAKAVSSIPCIIDAYLANKMHEAVKTTVQLQSNASEMKQLESNKSIHKSDEQKNLYKALVEAYESDKLILDTYGDTVWSKRRRAGKRTRSQPVQPKERPQVQTGKSTEGSKSLYKFAGESAHAEEPMHTAKDLEEPAHQEFYTGATEDQPVDETLSLLSAGPTFGAYEKAHEDLVELEYFFEEVYKATTDQLDWNNPEG
ncbi:hypothetical protein Tco_0144008 [Tanacetum coccineum]